MKKSFYNFLFENKGQAVIFNARTGALAELDVEHKEKIENYTIDELKNMDPLFVEALYDNGFVVSKTVSELDMIRYDMLQARFGNQLCNVVIAPTQDCNFGCKYCYEKGILKSRNMDEETQRATLDYIKENIIPESRLHICWYGGEPLLAIEIIEKMTKSLLEICEEKNVKYSADIITNGYLLTSDVAKKLVVCKISQVQITLDGDEETHNNRRPLSDGGETYKTIWNNLLALQEYRNQIKVALRINVDKGNESSIKDIKDRIDKNNLGDFVLVYLGKVMAVERCHNAKECFSSKEFAQVEQEYMCSDKNLIKYKYPNPRPIACSAECANSIIIDFEGNMYKCYMDIGVEKRTVGNVFGGQGHEEVLFEYLLTDVTNREDCKNCKYLPLCMGGCRKNNYVKNYKCTEFKYSLQNYMEHIPNAMKEERH